MGWDHIYVAIDNLALSCIRFARKPFLAPGWPEIDQSGAVSKSFGSSDFKCNGTILVTSHGFMVMHLKSQPSQYTKVIKKKKRMTVKVWPKPVSPSLLAPSQVAFSEMFHFTNSVWRDKAHSYGLLWWWKGWRTRLERDQNWLLIDRTLLIPNWETRSDVCRSKNGSKQLKENARNEGMYLIGGVE